MKEAFVKGVCAPSAGVDLRVAGGYPGGRPHAHQEGLLRRRLAQQPRHSVRLPRHEREPAVALQKGLCVHHRGIVQGNNVKGMH